MPTPNNIIKTLMPLVNQRLKALESGQAMPTAPAQSAMPWLNLPGVGQAPPTPDVHLNGPMGIDVNIKGADYNKLSSDDKALLDSVQRLGGLGKEGEHHSLLGDIFNAIEKPFHGIVGAVEKEADWQDASHSGESPWDKIVSHAKALGSGFSEGWHGDSDVRTFSDVLNQQHTPGAGVSKHLDIQATEPITNTGVGKAAVGLGGDIVLDPITYTGIGGLTKIKTLARSANDLKKIDEIEAVLKTAKHPNSDVALTTFGGDPSLVAGKWLPKSRLPTSSVRAHVMRNAHQLSKAYGEASFNQTFKANQAVARRQLGQQGYKTFRSLKAFQKAKGANLTAAQMSTWNRLVNGKVVTEAARLTGSRDVFVKAKAADALALASKNNLIGDAGKASSQFQKAFALKFAGKPLATIKVPEKVLDVSKAAANAAPKGVKDFAAGVHSKFDMAFRTGSHIDPVVNSMRMARHSSLIEKQNSHIANMNSIWGGITRSQRKDLAHAISQNLTHVVVEGGRDYAQRRTVTNLVEHASEQIKSIEDLVHSGQLTFNEFVRALPQSLKIPRKYAKDPEWLRKAWKDHFLDPSKPHLGYMANDPNVFINTMQRAAFTAMADKELASQISTRFGHLIKARGHTKDDLATKLLIKNHGYRTPQWRGSPHAPLKDIPEYKGVVFEDDVARGIEAMYQMMHSDAVLNGIGQAPAFRLFNNATAIFKTLITKYNPGFHERNLLGEMMTGLADGVNHISYYRQAAKVLRRHGRYMVDTGQDLGKGSILRAQQPGARVYNSLHPDVYREALASSRGTDIVIKKRFNDLKHKGATADQIWHAYVANGLKTGWISTDTGKYAGRFLGGKSASNVNAWVQHQTENIEDYARIAHFISRIERSPLKSFEAAAEDAAQYVRKYHFDYNDFTHLERSLFSKIIPFYKWTRKNIPLQIQLLFQRPGYFATQMKSLNAISNATGFSNNGNDIPVAEKVMPEWLQEHLAVPVGMGDSGMRYLDAPLPTTDAFKFFGGGPGDFAANVGYMTNPFVKDPYELLIQHQIGGAPLETNRYLAGQTPYTNLVNNLLNSNNTGKSTNLLQFLVGAGFVENTPARIRSELKRRQSAASKERKKYREKHNLVPLG